MKGPHERLKYDLRRLWECPVCAHKERTPGIVTSMICRCQVKEEVTAQKCMRLIEDGPRRIGPAPIATPPAAPQSSNS